MEKFGREFSGRGFWNEAIRENIYVSLEQIKHGMNVGGTVDKTKSLSILDKMISSAYLRKTSPDKDFPRRTVYEMVSLVNIDGKVYAANMFIKEDEKGRFYYHHDLFRQKKVS